MRALLTLLLLAAGTAAETGPGLLLQPRRPGDRAALETAVEVYLGGRTDAGADADLYWWTASGRWTPGGERGPVIGFQADLLEIDSADPRLPERLLDQSVAVGFGLGEWGGWTVQGLAGIGFAGDRPYGDGDAWYARGDLAATRRTPRGATWAVVLSFDGNRAVFPDVPLPAVSYTRFVRPGLFYSLGLPFSAVTWEFAPSWTLRARGLVPVSGSVEVARRLTAEWEAFGAYADRSAAFHVEGAPGNRRLFFGQRTLEAGLRFRPREGIEIGVGGGYAFDREFETGWDRRDTSTLAELDDVAFVRAEARFTW